MTDTAETPAASTSNELTPLREAVLDVELRLSDAITKENEAVKEIERLRKELSQWERFLVFQKKRRSTLDARLRADRDHVRALEDYYSNSDFTIL